MWKLNLGAKIRLNRFMKSINPQSTSLNSLGGIKSLCGISVWECQAGHNTRIRVINEHLCFCGKTGTSAHLQAQASRFVWFSHFTKLFNWFGWGQEGNINPGLSCVHFHSPRSYTFNPYTNCMLSLHNSSFTFCFWFGVWFGSDLLSIF